MNIYDAESVIRDLEELYKAKLNGEITLVNADKADTIVLDAISADRYLFTTLDSRILNFQGFWFMYGIMPAAPAQVSEESFKENIMVTLQIATFDPGDKDRANTLYKLFRYQRAVKQVILKNSDVFRGYSKPLVQSLEPAAFPYDNRAVILSIGINVMASITSS